MHIAVVVATLGRAEEVGQLLDHLSRQTVAPSAIVLSVEKDTDLPADLPSTISVVMGARGSSAQRNRGLDLIQAASDVVVFYDDDYVPSVYALEGIRTLFTKNADIVGATGLVLDDGVRLGGINYLTACEIVQKSDSSGQHEDTVEQDIRWAYGCNMAFRTAAIGEIRFDENLPLYGWQEDVDFAFRMRARGRVVKTTAFVGVHRGVRMGRTSGVRFGFSQIVNPVYLVRKGTMDWSKALFLILRNIVANHIRMFWPEPWIDRWGRVRGNWLGLLNIIMEGGRPQKVLSL